MSRKPFAPLGRANNLDDTSSQLHFSEPHPVDPPIVSSLSGLKARLSHLRRSNSGQSENEAPHRSASGATKGKEINVSLHDQLHPPLSSQDPNLSSLAPTRPALSTATLPPSPPASNREAGSTEPMSHPISRDAEPSVIVSRPSPQPRPSPVSTPRKVGAKSRRPHPGVGTESPNPRARKNVRSEDEDESQGDLPASQATKTSSRSRSKPTPATAGRRSRGPSAGLGASEQSFIREARKRAWDQVHTSPPTVRYLEPNPLPPTRYNPLANRPRSSAQASTSGNHSDNSQGSATSRYRGSSRTEELRAEGAKVKRSGSRSSVSTPPPAFRGRVSADPQRPPSPTDDPLLLKGRPGMPRSLYQPATVVKTESEAQYDWSAGDASVGMIASEQNDAGHAARWRLDEGQAADHVAGHDYADPLHQDDGVDFFGMEGAGADSPSPSPLPSRSASPAQEQSFADHSVASASREEADQEQSESGLLEEGESNVHEDISTSGVDSTSRYNEREDLQSSFDDEASGAVIASSGQDHDLDDSLRDVSGQNASEEISAQLSRAANEGDGSAVAADEDEYDDDDDDSAREDEVALISLSSSSGADDAGTHSQLTAATSQSSEVERESLIGDSFENAAKSFPSHLEEAEKDEEEADVLDAVFERSTPLREEQDSISASLGPVTERSAAGQPRDQDASIDQSSSGSKLSSEDATSSQEDSENSLAQEQSGEASDHLASDLEQMDQPSEQLDETATSLGAEEDSEALNSEHASDSISSVSVEEPDASAAEFREQQLEDIDEAPPAPANDVAAEASMVSADVSMAEAEDDEQDLEDSMHVETLLQSSRKSRQISGESDALSSTPLVVPVRNLLPLADATRPSPSPLLREAILHSSRVDTTERELSTAEQSIADMTASFSSQQNAEARARLHLQHSDRPIVEVSSTDGRVADRAMAILNHFGGWIERGGLLYEGAAESGQMAHAGPILPSDLAGIQEVLQQMDASTQTNRIASLGVRVSHPELRSASSISSLQTPARLSPPVRLALSVTKTPRPPGAFFTSSSPGPDKASEASRMEKMVERALSGEHSLRTDVKGKVGCLRDHEGNLTDDAMRSLMRVFECALEFAYKQESRETRQTKVMLRKQAAYQVRTDEVVGAFLCAHEIGARCGGGESASKERRITDQLSNAVPSLRRRYLLRLESAYPDTLSAAEKHELDAMAEAAEERRRLQREESVSTQASVIRKREREVVPRQHAKSSDAAKAIYPTLSPTPAHVGNAVVAATPASSVRGRMSGLMSTFTDRFLRSARESAPPVQNIMPTPFTLPMREAPAAVARAETALPQPLGAQEASPRRTLRTPVEPALSAPIVAEQAAHRAAGAAAAPAPPPPPPAPTAAKLQEAIRLTHTRDESVHSPPKRIVKSPKRVARASMDLSEIQQRAEARHRRVSSGQTSTLGSDKVAHRPSLGEASSSKVATSLTTNDEGRPARPRFSVDAAELNKVRGRLSSSRTSSRDDMHSSKAPVMDTAPIERARMSAARQHSSKGSGDSIPLYPDLSTSARLGSRALGHAGSSGGSGGLGSSSFVQLTPLACLSPDSHLRAVDAVKNLAERRKTTAWVSPRKRRQSAAAPVRFADLSVSISADGVQTSSPSTRSPARRASSSSRVLPSRD